jgi:hypothetical protein
MKNVGVKISDRFIVCSVGIVGFGVKISDRFIACSAGIVGFGVKISDTDRAVWRRIGR